MDRTRDLTPGLRLVVILGSTASGKTALAIHVAKSFGGEVVSADSRYFYRGMDIGTATPSIAEREGIAHHLIDIRDPDDSYSLAAFLDDAYGTIEDIARRGQLPVVAGGTPQYVRALIEGWRVPHVEPDETYRAELALRPTDDLYAELASFDPVSAERIGPSNKRRMIRALEVNRAVGKPMSEVAGAQRPPYRMHVIGLYQSREVLYPRIDQRVRDMFDAGWLDEVRKLRDRGISAQHPAMSAHGYREALEVIEGTTSLEDAIERTCFMIHKYVRHQQTWFRRFPNVTWYDSAIAGYESVVLDDLAVFLGDRTPVNRA